MPVSRCGTLSQLDGHAELAARPHLAGGAGQPGRAHILNAQDSAGLHDFQAGFEQKFFEERVAHLDVRAFLFGAFGELLAGHGGAVDAVSAGLGPDVEDRVADAFGLGIEDLVRADEAKRKGIDQRVAGVARLKARLAAKVGDAEAVAVSTYAVDDAGHGVAIACEGIREQRVGISRRDLAVRCFFLISHP